MKKKNVINLIKYYAENNNFQFLNEAVEVARYFDETGDNQLSEYIISLISGANVFAPQNSDLDDAFLKKVEINSEPLPLPEVILEDIRGVMNAINHKAGINKFLFEGSPGTGKTETAKQLARLLNRSLFSVDFNALIDSKLGQSAKNIASIFDKINKLPHPDQVIILFDEIDAIALDRVDSSDIREMGRATSAILKEFDRLNEDIVVIATTNLFAKFDKALARRFDAIINFDRYSKEDLIEVAVTILTSLLKRFKNAGHEMRLFKKILSNLESIPYPGDLKNLIKSSLAFSNPASETDYLKRLAKTIITDEISVGLLREKGFTVREIEILTGVSKSQVGREIKVNE